MDQTSEKIDPTTPPATDCGPKPPIYEPPAVAWDEPFEPVAASCAFLGGEPACFVRPEAG
jgi:hypothetical protein